MAVNPFTPRGRALAAGLASRVWRDFSAASRHAACLGLFALGVCCLGLGLGLESDRAPTTRFMLEAVESWFGVFAGLAVVVGSAVLGPVRPGLRVLARLVALALLGAGCWSATGLAAAIYQLLHGQKPELALYGTGLYINLGWNTLHLAALAVFFQAVTRRPWLGAAATIAVYAVSNLAFAHPLLRFGAPVLVWSDMNGYGQARTWQFAAGIYWTAICALLLVAAHVAARRRTSWRRRLSGAAGATAWAAVVFAVAAASWVLVNSPSILDHPRYDGPAPSYSRLDLTVDIFPAHLDLTTSGSAVVVNRGDIAIPDVLFALPAPLVFTNLSLTGELMESAPNWRRYRLNRPLEPQETLRFDFEAHWPTRPLPSLRGERDLHANGASLRIADLVPALDEGAPNSDVRLRIRLGTALGQVAVAPGGLTRTWKQEGRRYFEYTAEQPVALAASIHSGRYEVARAQCGNGEIEVYIHPPHEAALPPLLAAAHEAMRCTAETDRRGSVRIVETPDHARTTGPWRWFDRANRNTPAVPLAEAIAAAPAGVVPYSEIEVARLLPHGGGM